MTREPKPWLVLGSVVTAQLMVGVDATILALAVPGMSADLSMSSGAIAWVMAGYVLTAGSLMIAGGRIAQAVGYPRVMTIGLILFGLASAVGGAAHVGWLLIAARVGQGLGAAMMTPAAMARLSASFPQEGRAKAYGVFGMIMGSGTAIGLLLGGFLTQLAGWRACMYVNIAFVAVALILSVFAGDRVDRAPGHGRGWWRGLILAVGAALLIQALTAMEHPARAAAFGVAGVLVIGAFVALDRRTGRPLVPAVLFRDPTRRVAYGALFMWGIATITTFVTASSVLQHEHGFAPLVVGALFLVYPAMIQLGLFVARRFDGGPVTRSIGIGLALICAGQTVYAFDPEGLAATLGALALMGVGTSQVMPNANSAMNRHAGPHSGVAGAVGTTLQQLGGSVGLAVPVALATVTTPTAGVAAGITALALSVGAVLAFLAHPGAVTAEVTATDLSPRG